MKRLSPIFFLLLVFSPLNIAEGKGHNVEVRLSSPRLLEMEPGRIVTCSFIVSNHTYREEEFFETLNLPTDWQPIISSEFPFKLKAKQRLSRVMAFFIPISSPAGRYRITYSAKSRRDYGITDSDSFSVVVLPIVKVEMLIEDKPEVVIAGDVYEVSLRLINRGNSKSRVKLEIKGIPDYPIEIEVSEMTLDAGKSKVLKFMVKTDKKLKKGIGHILNIKAVVKEPKNGIVFTKQTVLVGIIPKVTCRFDPYHRLPTRMRLIGAEEKGKDSFQGEFSGSGDLDEEGKRKMDFLFRGHDIYDKNIHGKRDEYRFGYYGRLVNLLLGDRSYSLSPLTERYRYGRGAEINIHPSNFEIGSFYLESRWDEPVEKGIGTHLEYKFNDNFGIRGNFLNKTKEPYDDKIYSIQLKIEPTKKINLDLEGGFSNSIREEEFTDSAYRINLNGEIFHKVWCSFEKIHAEPKFFGYYNDRDYNSDTITFPIYDKLRGNISYSSYKNNLDLDSSKDVATEEEAYKTGLFYPFSFGMRISFDYKNLLKKDRLLPPDYDYEENLLKLRLEQTFSKLSFHTYVEKGMFEDKLLNTKNEDLERYAFYTYFRLSSKQTYSVYSEIGHDTFWGSPERSENVGISSTWRVGNIYFNLNYKNYRKDNFERHNISSTLLCTLPYNHSLTLRSRWFKYKESEEEKSSHFFTYTIPLEIPVSKRKNIGSIKGKVYDEEMIARVPMPNVILKVNGITAVTNKKGEFTFPSLKPGTYSLMVDKKSIGLNRVTSEKLPIMVEVKEGKTSKVGIGVINSSRISGKVIFSTLEDDKNKIFRKNLFLLGSGRSDHSRDLNKKNIEKVRGVSNVLVEINNGGEVWREVTDEKGRFCFENIRPGKWVVKFFDDNLPSHYYFEKSKFQVELKPRKGKKITLRVLPRRRVIRIIEEGEIR